MHESEPRASVTISLYQVNLIWRVAGVFRHFTPFLTTDDTVNKNFLKRYTLGVLFICQIFGIVPIEFDTRHDHAGDPEENNIETCN